MLRYLELCSGLKKILLSFFYCMLFFLYGGGSYAYSQHNYLWNIEKLEEVRTKEAYIILKNKIIATEQRHINDNPIVITDKIKSFSGDYHNYESYAGYWWPNPDDPNGPYIQKDGVDNPEASNTDSKRLTQMNTRLRSFAVAFYLSRDTLFFNAYKRQLVAWFIEPDTKMNPNMEYAGIIPGITGEKGRPAGLIQAYVFNDILESIRLVNSIMPLDDLTYNKITRWFEDFTSWFENSQFGIIDRAANNNHGIANDVTLYNLCLFVGNYKRCKEIRDSFPKIRLKTQIDMEGKMPAELERTKSYSYSIMNLKQIVDFCCILESQGIYFYNTNHEIIDRAVSFLLRYWNDPQNWPYKEIGNWKNCQRELQLELSRLDRLCLCSSRLYSYHKVTISNWPKSLSELLK